MLTQDEAISRLETFFKAEEIPKIPSVFFSSKSTEFYSILKDDHLDEYYGYNPNMREDENLVVFKGMGNESKKCEIDSNPNAKKLTKKFLLDWVHAPDPNKSKDYSRYIPQEGKLCYIPSEATKNAETERQTKNPGYQLESKYIYNSVVIPITDATQLNKSDIYMILNSDSPLLNFKFYIYKPDVNPGKFTFRQVMLKDDGSHPETDGIDFSYDTIGEVSQRVFMIPSCPPKKENCTTTECKRNPRCTGSLLQEIVAAKLRDKGKAGGKSMRQKSKRRQQKTKRRRSRSKTYRK